MLNTHFKATDPMQLLKEKCAGCLPIDDAVIRATHQALLKQKLDGQDDLESQSVELQHTVLDAVSGLMAIETGKVETPSFDSMVKVLQRGRGSPDD